MKYSLFVHSTILAIIIIMLYAAPTVVAQGLRTDRTKTAALKVKPGSGTTLTEEQGLTPGRARSLIAGALGLASILAGWGAGARRFKAGLIAAFAAGICAIALCTVHLSASAQAGVGAGSGKAGAIIALILGIAGSLISLRSLRKAKRQ